MKILIVYYSMYGHVHSLAEAVADGVREVSGAEAILRRVPETLSQDVLEKMGATQTQRDLTRVPVCTLDELVDAHAIIFGTPTRFGNMCGQMRQFLDATGELCVHGRLVGKPASVFTSSSTQHGGQEATILSFHATLLHYGMIIIGLPYTYSGLNQIDEISGGSPYGAATITGSYGGRTPSENELMGARYQGRHVASITAKLIK
jgi:NAD(P)H dehydrogenase (quinone)